MIKKTFKGGIHPLPEMHQGKGATNKKPIRPFVSDTVCIPMNMHIAAAPSTPCVKKGDHVKLGQVIGEAVGPRGIPVHASVSGTVMDVSDIQQLNKVPSTCVTIQNDFADEWVELNGLGDVETCDASKIIPAIRDAGICGMGGACFPTHAKLSIPEGKSVDTVILNGAECETFLTADHRLMLETPERVVNGLRAAMRALNVKNGYIAIEDNKMDAIAAVSKAAQGREGVQVVALKAKYPQGAEKQIIKAVTGREVPSGGLPMDAHCVVLNVATAAAISDAVTLGKPLIERVTTVTGGVREPDNLLLRVGTIFLDAIGACGGYAVEPGKIFAGGSMTGICAPSDTVSMTKANNGIVVLDEKQAKSLEETACIRCGRCVEACPIHLDPYKLKNLCDQNELKAAKDNHIMDCMLCGCCSYVCPARRWIMSSIKNARELIAARRI